MTSVSTQQPLTKNSIHPVEFIPDASELLVFFQSRGIRPDNSLVVSDENIWSLKPTHYSFLEDFPTLLLPSGESSKALPVLLDLYTKLDQLKIDRTGAILALGGGAIGDIVGFAASTYLRGIRLFHIPTTLLAMVDSSIGGKNALNFQNKKNQIGTVYQPEATLIDVSFLETLPRRDFNSGIAEVIKYALLSKEALLFKALELTLTPKHKNELPAIINQCIQIKLSYIQSDITESLIQSPRMFLNLGHTFAHAIESADTNSFYSHGEAVAIGLLMALYLSKELGLLHDESLITKTLLLIKEYNLPTKLSLSLKIDSLMSSLSSDKKRVNKQNQFILLQSIGNPLIQSNVSAELLIQAWIEAGAQLS